MAEQARRWTLRGAVEQPFQTEVVSRGGAALPEGQEVEVAPVGEIAEALRAKAFDSRGSWGAAADFIETRFGGKDA